MDTKNLLKGLGISVVALIIVVFFVKNHIDTSDTVDKYWETVAVAAEGYYDYKVIGQSRNERLTIQEGDDRFTYTCNKGWSEGTGSFMKCTYAFEDGSISPGEFLWNRNRTQIDEILSRHNLETEYRGRGVYIRGSFEDANAAFNELLTEVEDFKKAYEIHKRLQGQVTRWEVGNAEEFDNARITIEGQQGLFDWAMEVGL